MSYIKKSILVAGILGTTSVMASMGIVDYHSMKLNSGGAYDSANDTWEDPEADGTTETTKEA